MSKLWTKEKGFSNTFYYALCRDTRVIVFLEGEQILFDTYDQNGDVVAITRAEYKELVDILKSDWPEQVLDGRGKRLSIGDTVIARPAVARATIGVISSLGINQVCLGSETTFDPGDVFLLA